MITLVLKKDRVSSVMETCISLFCFRAESGISLEHGWHGVGTSTINMMPKI